MHAIRLTRRASLLLPFLLAACGGEERADFPPLRYNYLPPIRLNVASVGIEQRFYPSGIAPDITALDPVHPVEALRAMAEDRLQALGTSGQAVFGITNASLTRQDDVITCALAVVLEIYPTPGIRSGFAQAVVSRQHTGHIDDLRDVLYDITKAAMDAMNVEFEYQVRNNLRPWLLSASAMPLPVERQPLDTGPNEPLPGAPPMQPPPGMSPMAPPLGMLPVPPPQGTPPSQ
ncbi:MAG TPA: hypothetical protein VND19_13610 [Acetobacteraceae bacterium]|nr:hypothetical protein [Acetobacteraceae bacterium]